MKIALLFFATALSPLPAQEQISAEQSAFFEKNIRPVLANKCYDCHSAKSEKVKGGLLLDTRDGIRRGGDTGPAVVPGKPDKSLLIAAIRYTDKDTQMPPQKSGGKLPEDVIVYFEQWIRMGAPDPRDGTAKSVAEMDKDKAKQFWSFLPPKKSTPPTVADTSWPRTDIDHFVLATLEQKNLHPVADTEPRALLRRVYFDLIGMPPSSIEANEFLAECAKGADAQRKAFESVVDKLLNSPRYGERWGRHWLDVARYSESSGKEANSLYPTAWRYRDYVIESFNEDKPYDEFIREQIAGDLMGASSASEYNEHLTATAFLAMGSKNLTEKNKLQFTLDVVDEQIDATTKSVLALTVACARCHDHKFDPITTRDYYALAGIFRSTETCYGTTGASKPKNRNPSVLMSLADPSKSLAEQPNNLEKPLVNQASGKNKKNKKKNKLAYDAPKDMPQKIMHQIMGAHDGNIANCPIYLKGEPDDPGAAVPRGVVALLTNGNTPAIPTNASGRLQVAEWLTAKDNPLTARVMVNRVWQQLFGAGIVRTADNFGATGEQPTHPELLDFLAINFMDNEWSVKKLIREIVLSHVYALATSPDKSNAQIDPSNNLLWRANARRLDAEAIRDAMLTASGLMDLKPPGGSMVASAGDGSALAYSRTFVNAQFHYRSVYLPIVRDFVPSCLEVFDFSEPSFVVASRDVTNVPSQALYMMNNPFVIEQAKALAHRISIAAGLDHRGRITLAYELALCRPPTEAERSRADNFLRDEVKDWVKLTNGKLPAAAESAYATFCQTLFASAEFRYLADSLPNQSARLP